MKEFPLLTPTRIKDLGHDCRNSTSPSIHLTLISRTHVLSLCLLIFRHVHPWQLCIILVLNDIYIVLGRHVLGVKIMTSLHCSHVHDVSNLFISVCFHQVPPRLLISVKCADSPFISKPLIFRVLSTSSISSYCLSHPVTNELSTK